MSKYSEVKVKISGFFKTYRLAIIFICIMAILSFAFSNIVIATASKMNGITIVIDAGHGGRDGGSVGVNGTVEKEINLLYALTLKEKLVENGYKVILTRSNDDGLYSPLAKNKKQSDMNKRMEIIKKANPNLVISIHMNSFSNPNAKGSSVYYRLGDSSGERCAQLIQKSFNCYCSVKGTTGKVGDYYILNCSYYTSVLIECGFISNPDEERNLNSKDYRNKIINSIYYALTLYFGNYNGNV